MSKSYSFLLIVILFIIVSFGTTGFMIIEDWSFFDSLYMTVITLTTIGYGETNSLSEAGRIFNIFLIIVGAGTATFTITQLLNSLASIDFDKRRRMKMLSKISKLSQHTIVCGYGRMGEVICKKLAENKTQFVVLEKRQSLIDELKKTDFLYIDGDAASDENLELAGIEKAYALVSVIDSDGDGLYISLAARSMNEKLYIITRANDQMAKKRMLRAGANKVILPFVMSGQKVADCIMNPATEDLFDITTDKVSDEGDRIILADLTVKSDCLLKGKDLKEMGSRLEGLIVIGVKNPSGEEFNFKPGSRYIFQENDCLITMGPKDKFSTAKSDLRLG